MSNLVSTRIRRLLTQKHWAFCFIIVLLTSSCAMAPTQRGNRIYGAPLVIAPPFYQEQSTGYGQCNLNHKTMIADIDFCGIKNGKNDCFRMTVKIEFLGKKIIYYNSLEENSGIIFDLGSIVDLTTDQRQENIWRASPRPGYSFTALATASLNGDRLNLKFQTKTTETRTGILAAVMGQSMNFRACADSCDVLDYVIYFDNGRPMERDEQRLIKQSCYFQ